MKKMLSAFLILILAQVATVASGAQSRLGSHPLSVDLSAQASGQDARLWIPYPVSGAHQVTSGLFLSITMS